MLYLGAVKFNIHTLTMLSLLAFSSAGCDDASDEFGDATAELDAFRSGSLELDAFVEFNPLLGETPESGATDLDGNIYVILALTGEVVKIDPSGNRTHLAWLPLGDHSECVGPFPAITGALAINVYTGDLFMPVNACGEEKGIYQVSTIVAEDVENVPTMIASLPATTLGNGIALRLGKVYVSDSGSPQIFTAPVDGAGEPADVWTVEPMLADADPYDGIPGANGLQFFGGRMWVTNASEHSLIAIDIEFPLDGSGDIEPGDAELVFAPIGSGATWEQDVEVFPGCDDFAFDVLGGIWCSTDPFQTVVRLSQITGDAEIVFDPLDGLDGPSSVVFGRGLLRKTIYVTNAMFPFPGFVSTGNGPSVLKGSVPIGGYLLR